MNPQSKTNTTMIVFIRVVLYAKSILQKFNSSTVFVNSAHLADNNLA